MYYVSTLMWWERERLLTSRDKEAIVKARLMPWEDIDTSGAETDAGRYELLAIRRHKMLRAEGEGI